MEPLYTTHNTRPAYQLNWGMTIFWRRTPIPEDRWLAALRQCTEPDGVRIIKHRIVGKDASQFFISTQPHVAPSDLIRSVKGRLQHSIAQQCGKAFQRNYCLRSIGSATRDVVEAYVGTQLGHHRMADPRVQQRLETFQRSFPDVDLRKPAFSSHGEYWYNLHLVIVNEGRWMEIREDVFEGISTTIERAAKKHQERLSRMAILADHIHLAVGCPVERSPEEVALGYLNNCAFACGMKPVFQYGYYVGTFGEYDRGAV